MNDKISTETVVTKIRYAIRMQMSKGKAESLHLDTSKPCYLYMHSMYKTPTIINDWTCASLHTLGAAKGVIYRMHEEYPDIADRCEIVMIRETKELLPMENTNGL